MKEIKVLFVCMGNICRSPTAEGVFRHIVQQEGLDNRIHTDSAGTHAYHVGNPPDNRAQQTARGRGINLSDLRARKVVSADFESFDYVLAMDRENHYMLEEICPSGYEDRLFMFLEFAPNLKYSEVPDPYYGGQRGFEDVFDMVEVASRGLIAHIRDNHL